MSTDALYGNGMVMMLRNVFRRLRRVYRRHFKQKNFVFRHEGPFTPETRDDCAFASYESFDSLPEAVKKARQKRRDKDDLAQDKLELDENATLWVAYVDGQVASTVFTRRGNHFRRWFVELKPDDVVVFRLNTREQYRGRGLAPSLIRHALCSVGDDSASAYIDCRTYNKPSKRAIEKVGFHCIAIKKTITREWALYD